MGCSVEGHKGRSLCLPSKYGPGSSPPGGAIPEGGIAIRLLPAASGPLCAHL
jgi:hypothetical protein